MRYLALLILCLASALLHADDDSKPHLVMLIAEREYQTEQTLPPFAKQHLDDYRTTFVYAAAQDNNRLVGIEAVATADVLLVSVRRRTLPKDQLEVVRRYVAAGKPVIGIRTASHAFCLRGKEPAKGFAQWETWDKDVFGGNYTNHYGNKLTTTYQAAKTAPRELLSGIDTSKSRTTGGSLYKVAPLAKGATVILTGSVDQQPPEPMAWTFIRSDGGKSFYTSLGHVDDFAGDVLPKLLVNAIHWSLQKNQLSRSPNS